jgi:hypothetical protein
MACHATRASALQIGVVSEVTALNLLKASINILKHVIGLVSGYEILRNNRYGGIALFAPLAAGCMVARCRFRRRARINRTYPCPRRNCMSNSHFHGLFGSTA